MTNTWQRFKRDITNPRKFPGMGRAETVLNRLASTQHIPRGERVSDSWENSWRKIHPRLYRPAHLGLNVIGWWHYHVTRSACKEGSRLCWDKSHWRNGELGALARELHRQMSDLERRRR